MSKTCSKCRYFTAYYKKAYSCFLRTDCGNCNKKLQTVEKRSSCEEWQYFKPMPRKKGLVVRDLNNLMASINAIKLILEEEKEQ